MLSKTFLRTYVYNISRYIKYFVKGILSFLHFHHNIMDLRFSRNINKYAMHYTFFPSFILDEVSMLYIWKILTVLFNLPLLLSNTILSHKFIFFYQNNKEHNWIKREGQKVENSYTSIWKVNCLKFSKHLLATLFFSLLSVTLANMFYEL